MWVPAIGWCGRVRANQAVTEVGRPGRPQLIADRAPHAPQNRPSGRAHSIVPEHHIGTCRHTKQGLTLIAGSGLEFADHGEHQLKGVDQPWRIFSVAT